jgi:hypothetical protein
MKTVVKDQIRYEILMKIKLNIIASYKSNKE